MFQLVRPGIVAMVLFTMTVAAVVVGSEVPETPVLVNSLLGAAGVIVGAIVLNQRLERRGDARMARTASRPLPAGRLTERQATWFGGIASVAGLGYLWMTGVPSAVTGLAATSWGLYVWIYTPWKRRGPWQTPVGALAGAMPVLLGAAVAEATLSPMSLALFGLVYFWQFPHAMAIAWLYREQFASADVKLASVVDPTGRAVAWLSLIGAVAVLPLGLAPVAVGRAGWGYGSLALVLGLGYLAGAIWFFRRRDDPAARWLLRASFVYLPGVLVGLLATLRAAFP